MKQRHKGFTLLEVLVAFMIMAVALTIVLRVFGSALSNAGITEEYDMAVQIAESLMARSGVETPLEIGEIGGIEADKYAWRINVKLLSDNTSTQKSGVGQEQSTSVTRLFSVKVRVIWQDAADSERSIELENLKIL